MKKDILQFGALELATVCTDATAGDFEMIKDMYDTFTNTLGKPIGYGLAANQIGYTKKCILISPELSNKTVKFLANPKILNHGKDIVVLPEGCLSKKGIKEIGRYRVIDVEYYDETWTKRTETFKGISARIIQHELNHLDGLDCLENRL